MVDPVSGGIWGERRATCRYAVVFVIEWEEDTEAGMRKKCMCRLGKNVIV
jgi:hypothetical protein